MASAREMCRSGSAPGDCNEAGLGAEYTQITKCRQMTNKGTQYCSPPHGPAVLAGLYKQGQAGVTKATVCITFNNEDERQIPEGWKDKKKITVTRQVRTAQ